MSKDLLSTNKITNLPLFGLSIFASTVIFFVSQYLPIFVIVIFLAFLGKDQEQATALFTDNQGVLFAALSLVATTSVYMVYRYLLWRGDKPFKFLMIAKKPPTLSQLGEIAITYGLYFVTLIIITVILSIVTTLDVNQAQDLGISHPTTLKAQLYVFATLVILPPISEEILFRGLLFNKLKKYSGTIIATISVSMLFGLAHLEYSNLNWIAVIDTLIFSVFLINISQKHKSLYSAMLLHAIKNGIAFYVLFVR